jgi:hypothetical protein
MDKSRMARTNVGRVGSRTLAALTACIGLAIVAAAPAGAAVTLGQTFPPTVSCSGGAGQTWIQPTSPSGQYTVPSDGVLTSWSYQAGATAAPTMRLKAVHETSSPSFQTVARGSLEDITLNQLNTFNARLKVHAGDVIGFFSNAATTLCTGATAPGYTLGGVTGDPLPTDPPAAYSLFTNLQLDLSAKLEADIDNDGYGDETQDFCPISAAQQTPCPDKTAPETTITKSPPKKTKSKKATFEFSSEAGVTFKCSLDGASFDVCTSPKTYTVGKGRHSFVVFAKDTAGNVDDSPATYSWTVKKKKKHH